MDDANGKGRYISVQDAARELSTTHLKVLMLVKQGVLEGVMEGGEWQVSSSSVECLKEHGIDPATQASCRTSCTASGCHCK